jgi:hypothetical protein
MSHNRTREFSRWPRFERAYRKSFAAAAAAAAADKCRTEWRDSHPLMHLWTSGDAMFDWWMNEDRSTPDEDSDQGVLFE